MRPTRLLSATGSMLLVLAAAWAPGTKAAGTDPAVMPVVHIEDVTRFYDIYDAAGGHPSADALQRDYVERGSDGLQRLARLRHVDGRRIADNLARHPEIYVHAKRCLVPLPRVRERLRNVLGKLFQMYPQGTPAPVTVAVGRGKPVGVTDATGVIIGLEALCAVNYFDADVEDRFVHVIAHEYAHVQQAVKAPAFYDKPQPTVLEQSLIEGAAEFTGELISGSIAHVDLPARVRGHEQAIETAFVGDEDKTDLSAWLYNGTLTEPGDLGYWVGYRIVKSYYQHARDKRAALRDILEMNDAKAFLAKSGWRPGIRLESKLPPRR